MSNTYRCTCCGRVNRKALANTADDFIVGPFFPDPQAKYPGDVLCNECYNEIKLVKETYDDDEFYLYADSLDDKRDPRDYL